MKKMYTKKLALACLLAAVWAGSGMVAQAQKTYDLRDTTGKAGSFLLNIRAQKMIFGAINAADNGKDQDLLIFKVGNETTGGTLTFPGIELYKNDGTGNYSLNSSAFTALKKGNGAWSKVDGYIVLTGLDAGNGDAKTTLLYKRNGSGAYIPVATPVDGTSAFPGITGFAGFFDFNGDGKDDIFLVDNDTGTSYLYENLGSDQFTLISNPVDGTAPFPTMILNNYQVTGVVFGDYNKDGKQDIIVAAKIGTGANDTYVSIYRNNGDNTFSKVSITLDNVPNTNFPGAGNGSIDLGDLDKDGFATDIAVQGNTSGSTATNARIFKVFKQDATNTEKYTTVLSYTNGSTGQTTHGGGKRYGQVIFGDLTGSGFKKDLITTGQTSTGNVTTEVFICDGAPYTNYTIYSKYGNNPAAYLINTTAFASFVWDNVTNSSYRFFAFGDVNGDGQKNDIAKFGVPANSAPASMAALYTYNGTALPVNFISFSATANGSSAKLSWKTATEKNNAYFIIEKSTDGQNYAVLTQVASQGDKQGVSNYVAFDKQPAQVTYYRLSQVDKDGTRTHLGDAVLSLKINNSIQITAYPNPASEKLNVEVLGYAGKTILSVKDLVGKTLLQQVGHISQGGQLTVDVSNLSTGTYIVEVSGDNFKQSQKVLVK